MVDDTSFQLGGGSRAVLDNYQYDAALMKILLF
jgi:hypothetical protein